MINTLKFLKYNLDENNNLRENKYSELLKNELVNLIECNTELLLDVTNNNNNNNSSFDIVENFVNNIFLFHSKRLNLDLNNEYYVSFSAEDNDKFHVNYFISEEEKLKERIYPICTTLTYLNNSMNPVVITDLDFEDYKYKNFKNPTNLLFSFPFKFEHICFEGKYYYGIPNIYEDKNIKPQILKVNIWDKKPNNINYYISKNLDNNDDNDNLNFIFKESPFHRQLCLDKSIINKNFLDEMLYAKNNDVFMQLKEIFDNIENYYIIEEDIQINKRLEHRLPVEVNLFDCNNLLVIQTEKLPLIQNKTFNDLKNKYGNILYDLYTIYYKRELANTNRFYNYKLIQNYFTKDICKWFTSQIDTFVRKQQIQKSSLIKCENLTNIFDFCLVVIESLYDNLSKIYYLNNITIDISNISILYLNHNIKNDNGDNGNNENDKEINLIKNHIKNNNSFLMGIFQLNENFIKVDENIKLNMGDLLFANTLRLDEIDLFKNKNTEKNNYYLIYEINFDLSL